MNNTITNEYEIEVTCFDVDIDTDTIDLTGRFNKGNFFVKYEYTPDETYRYDFSYPMTEIVFDNDEDYSEELETTLEDEIESYIDSVEFNYMCDSVESTLESEGKE